MSISRGFSRAARSASRRSARSSATNAPGGVHRHFEVGDDPAEIGGACGIRSRRRPRAARQGADWRERVASAVSSSVPVTLGCFDWRSLGFSVLDSAPPVLRRSLARGQAPRAPLPRTGDAGSSAAEFGRGGSRCGLMLARRRLLGLEQEAPASPLPRASADRSRIGVIRWRARRAHRVHHRQIFVAKKCDSRSVVQNFAPSRPGASQWDSAPLSPFLCSGPGSVAAGAETSRAA